MSKQAQMQRINNKLLNLKQSPLYDYRTENRYIPVVGEGNLDADIVFIGEAPGKNEAITGKPFCGASGKVLDQLLEHIKLTREAVYITNIVKDRPQDNRDPKPEEIGLYAPFLNKQLEIIQPRVIATLGRFSMEYVMKIFGLEDKLDSISILHGKSFNIKTVWGEIIFVPLYHPAVAVYNRKRLGELKKDFEKLN
jgi:DNA polymerase